MKNELIKAAKAVMDAQEAREASWNGISYDKNTTECYAAEYEKANLSPELISLLLIADYSWNDIFAWADRTLNS